MALVEILQNFADGTTMHGVPKAIRARTLFGRIFWSTICLAAASMFCVQFAQLLAKYYSFPKKVSIEIMPIAVPFPAISLCNMRNLDTVVLNTLNKIFKGENDTMKWMNATDDDFIQNYLEAVSKYYPMYLHDDLDFEMYQTVLTRTTIATNIDRSKIAKAGVPFDEFIVTCRFGGKPCNRTYDFSQFFDPYYYNCFTYIAPISRDPESTLAEGLENGWSTTVLSGSDMLEKNKVIRSIPGTHEYLSPMSASEGVRVVIHPPDTQPYPHTEGFDVPPGFSASLGVKARQNIRVGRPHGNCSYNNPFGGNDKQYRLIACQKMCLQKAVVDECDCKDIGLPGHDLHEDVEFCTNDSIVSRQCRLNATDECMNSLKAVYEKIVCAKRTIAAVTRNATAIALCNCYPPCEEISYDVAYSLANWPAESFDGDEAYTDIFFSEQYPNRFKNGSLKDKLYGEYFVPENRRRAMRNFARLNVFIADSNVLKTEESEDYMQSQMLSDLGGQLGLWVGISAITLVEVLQLLIDLIRCCTRKHSPYSKGTTFSKPPEEKFSCAHCHSCHRTFLSNGVPASMHPLTAVEVFTEPGNIV